MHYLGGKHRIKKRIVDSMLPYIKDQIFIEPFCGGLNITAEMGTRNVVEKHFASDSMECLISMYESIQRGWTPPTHLSEETYHKLKQAMDPLDPLTAFAGFGLSYCGKFFHGYCRDNTKNRSYAMNARNSLLRKFKTINCEFFHGDYREWSHVKNSVFYCDPPYEGTTRYYHKFCTETFWEWARMMSKHNLMFISEVNAPNDFEIIWENNSVENCMSKNKSNLRTERLFFKYC